MTDSFGFTEDVENKSLGVWSYIMKKFSEKEKTEKEVLLENLKVAQVELDTAINNYDFAKEPELVDYYTYNIKAAQMRYEYLLKKVKKINEGN
ncbi:MAG: DUF2508 family protein [Clostridia bacterium]|nr:DUF2508 family protein [Clostridia bacterium]